jgi:NAD-dependent SIR2 family protein deacetylase
MNNNKIVYFLGAGFSAEAGAPTQKELLKTILSPAFNAKYQYNKLISNSIIRLNKFICDILCIERISYDRIELETIFTLIDKCLNEGYAIIGYSYNDLQEIREILQSLIGLAIHYKTSIVTSIGGNSYIIDFANYINRLASKRAGYKFNNIDEISVITTNWDIVLDKEFYNIIKNSDLKYPIALDYCCYMSSMTNSENIYIPGLYALGAGGYNIKYLKLHGSMNWANCPLCQRMYVGFEIDEMNYYNPCYCRHCRDNYSIKNTETIRLNNNLLLPTFLKDLSNLQIKQVWQNASIEISEASKIVFIGYSLPSADFEIKQLLLRCLRKDVEIEVILYPGKYPNSYECIKNIEDTKERFCQIFGDRIKQLSFIIQSVPQYIRQNCIE